MFRPVMLVLALGLTAITFTGCVPGEIEDGDLSQFITPVIFLVLIIGFLYFMNIRPQRRRQKEHKTFVADLKKGDNVMTAGGIYGQIESLADENVVLKIESGATLRIWRGSIISIPEQK
ncbi:preprotein translocase subunit YajC [Chloroflexota bacterium]